MTRRSDRRLEMMGSLTSEGKWSVIAVVTSVCAVFGANSQGDRPVCVQSFRFEFSNIHVSDLLTFMCVTGVTPNY